jgi:hypothetical protein
MKTIKIWQSALLVGSVAGMLFSCTENDDAPLEGESEVTISATVGNSESSPNARTNSLVYGNISITDVRMSVDNVKMILRAKSNDSKKPDIFQIRTNSPHTLTLVREGQVAVVPMGVGRVYNGVYGRVDFDLVKASDVPETDEMYGYSVITKATWFGIPAVMYLDIEEEVLVQFNKGLEVNGAKNVLLTLYMDKFLEGIPPSSVADGNSDGVIEVGPNNEDGNAEAYEMLVANIKEALVFKNGEFKD